jgi:inorganic pyrophosphatase
LAARQGTKVPVVDASLTCVIEIPKRSCNKYESVKRSDCNPPEREKTLAASANGGDADLR